MGFMESLLELRRGKGLSQEELATQVGVSRQAVSKWETGEAMPDLNKLLALSDALGVSIDRLCGKEDTTEAAAAPAVVVKKGRFWPVLCAVLAAAMLFLLWQNRALNMQNEELSALPLDIVEKVAGAEFSSSNGQYLEYRIIPGTVCADYIYGLVLIPETPVAGAPPVIALNAESGVFQGRLTIPLSASAWTASLRVEAGKRAYTVPVATDLHYSGNGLTSWQPVD